jgi:hypothetical protein
MFLGHFATKTGRGAMAGWSSMWGKIETEDQALLVIREASKGFFWLAGLQAVLGVLVYPPTLIDAVMYALLGYWLRKSNSRVAALLLLLIAAGALGVTAVNRFGGGAGGRNIFLAAFVFWACVRVVQATFKVSARAQPAMGGAPAPAPGQVPTNARFKVYG